MDNPADHPLKLDRVTQALRPHNLSSDTPRDVIFHVHYFEEKERTMNKAREAYSLDFDRAMLSLSDLVRETLDYCCALWPLTEKLCNKAIAYHWGFIATRDDCTATLRFPENLEKFCLDLNITPPELPGWQDDIPIVEPPPDSQKPLESTMQLPQDLHTKMGEPLYTNILGM